MGNPPLPPPPTQISLLKDQLKEALRRAVEAEGGAGDGGAGSPGSRHAERARDRLASVDQVRAICFLNTSPENG